MRYTPKEYADKVESITSLLLEANTQCLHVQEQLEGDDPPEIYDYFLSLERKIIEIVRIQQKLQERLRRIAV